MPLVQIRPVQPCEPFCLKNIRQRLVEFIFGHGPAAEACFSAASSCDKPFFCKRNINFPSSFYSPPDVLLNYNASGKTIGGGKSASAKSFNFARLRPKNPRRSPFSTQTNRRRKTTETKTPLFTKKTRAPALFAAARTFKAPFDERVRSRYVAKKRNRKFFTA